MVGFVLRAGMVMAVVLCVLPVEGAASWQQVCKKALAAPAPHAVTSGPLSEQQLPKCDERALYYGAEGGPNYAAALQCGWYQHAHPQSTVGNMFYGPGVLTMLYANGRGVARDLGAATRFACEEQWAAPAEMEGRIDHLARMQAGQAKGTFDLCDDITSGLSEGFCADVGAIRTRAVRSKKIAALVAAMPPDAQQAFPELSAAEAAFEQARTRGEIDLTGTARGMFAIEEEQTLQDQFLINLQRFGKGDVPHASPAQLAELQAKMDALYTQTQKAVPHDADLGGAVVPEGARTTQAAWQSLAEAWLRFAKVAYPQLPATDMRAQLIRLRSHQLRSVEQELAGPD